MLKEISILSYFSISSTILLILLFLYFRKRNNEKEIWAIFYYSILSLATDILLNFILKNHSTQVQRFFVYSGFTFFEYSFFSYFFYYGLTTKIFKNLVLIFYVTFIMVTLYSMKYRNEYKFDSFTAQIEAILIILLSIFFLYEQMNKPEINFVYATKHFWIVMAMLIYLSATMFLFILSNYMSKKDLERVWVINDFANIVKNIFFAIAVSKTGIVLIKGRLT